MHCSSAYNILFYSLFWGTRASDHLMRFSAFFFLSSVFFCTRSKHYYRKWTAEQMKLLPDVAKAIFLFEKFARFTWNARSMSSSACNFSHLLAKLTLVRHMALATQPSYGRFDGAGMNFNGFVGIFSGVCFAVRVCPVSCALCVCVHAPFPVHFSQQLKTFIYLYNLSGWPLGRMCFLCFMSFMLI